MWKQELSFLFLHITQHVADFTAEQTLQ